MARGEKWCPRLLGGHREGSSTHLLALALGIILYLNLYHLPQEGAPAHICCLWVQHPSPEAAPAAPGAATSPALPWDKAAPSQGCPVGRVCGQGQAGLTAWALELDGKDWKALGSCTGGAEQG